MKKIVSLGVIATILVTSLVILSGCSKNKISSEILGRWSRVHVEDVSDSTLIEDWEFLQGGEMLIHNANPGVLDTAPVECYYFIETYNQLSISGADEKSYAQDYNGSWRVIKLENNAMMIIHETSGLLFREFVKD